jgi:hypothetical protein
MGPGQPSWTSSKRRTPERTKSRSRRRHILTMPFHYVISQPLMVMELKLFFLFSRDTESISRSSQLAAQRTKTVPVSMASLVSQPRRSVQAYWARRNYRRLRVARLGGGRKQQQQQPWKRLACSRGSGTRTSTRCWRWPEAVVPWPGRGAARRRQPGCCWRGGRGRAGAATSSAA